MMMAVLRRNQVNTIMLVLKSICRIQKHTAD